MQSSENAYSYFSAMVFSYLVGLAGNIMGSSTKIS